MDTLGKGLRGSAAWVLAGMVALAGIAGYILAGSSGRELFMFAHDASTAISSFAANVSSAPAQTEANPSEPELPPGSTPAPTSAATVRQSIARRPEGSKSDSDSIPSLGIAPAGGLVNLSSLGQLPVTTVAFEAPVADNPLPADLAVYSQASAGVAPPIPLGSQLPRELQANLAGHQPMHIELIVLADGTVESAKLLNPPEQCARVHVCERLEGDEISAGNEEWTTGRLPQDPDGRIQRP